MTERTEYLLKPDNPFFFVWLMLLYLGAFNFPFPAYGADLHFLTPFSSMYDSEWSNEEYDRVLIGAEMKNLHVGCEMTCDLALWRPRMPKGASILSFWLQE